MQVLAATTVAPRGAPGPGLALYPLPLQGLSWGLYRRGLSLVLADFLLGGGRLKVRGPMPKLLCHPAAKSLRSTKIEPV
jgi:hypothetical protein